MQTKGKDYIGDPFQLLENDLDPTKTPTDDE
jgi:hypothetical protein